MESEDTSATGEHGNIDKAGARQRLTVGAVMLAVAVAVSLAIIFSVELRWWRVFVWPLYAATFATSFQGPARC